MTNNTSITPRSSFEVATNSQPVALRFLGPEEIIALDKTCKFFHEFLQKEQTCQDLLRNYYPLFKVPLREDGSLYRAHSSSLARLTQVPTNIKLGSFQPVRFRSDSVARCIKMAPNGMQFFATFEDNTIRRIDLETGKCTIIDSGRGIDLLQITPDGKNILVVSGHIVNITDLKTGFITQLVGHEGDIQCVKVSFNGKNIYTGSVDGTVKCWNFKTGECTNTISMPVRPHKDSRILQISRDGTVAISDIGGGMQVWSLETGKDLKILEGYDSAMDALLIVSEISFDKKTVISSHGNQVCIWDLTTGKLTRIFSPTQLFGFAAWRRNLGPGLIVKMSTTPDLKRAILGCSNGAALIINFETQDRARDQSLIYNFEPTQCMEISPYGETVIISGSDVKIYDFTLLPEERLTKVAQNLLKDPREQRWAIRSPIKAILDMLPPAIADTTSGNFGCDLAENLDIINAIEVGLPSIQGRLEQALKEPNSSASLVKEAIERINNLTPFIKDVVYKYCGEITYGAVVGPEKLGPVVKFFSQLDEPLLKDEDLTRDRIKAIARAIAEFKQIAERKKDKLRVAPNHLTDFFYR